MPGRREAGRKSIRRRPAIGARAALELFADADHSFHLPARSARTDPEVRDAQAFIKLYVAEAGTGALRRAVRNATAVYAIDATYVEVCAAFARAGQTGLLRTKHAEAARADFDRDWQSVNVVSPDAAMLGRAADVAGTEGLSASVGLNLAAAEAIKSQLGASFAYRIGIADPNGAAFAKRLGLPTLDPGRQESETPSPD